jgi:hypothetical protein
MSSFVFLDFWSFKSQTQNISSISTLWFAKFEYLYLLVYLKAKFELLLIQFFHQIMNIFQFILQYFYLMKQIWKYSFGLIQKMVRVYMQWIFLFLVKIGFSSFDWFMNMGTSRKNRINLSFLFNKSQIK